MARLLEHRAGAALAFRPWHVVGVLEVHAGESSLRGCEDELAEGTREAGEGRWHRDLLEYTEAARRAGSAIGSPLQDASRAGARPGVQLDVAALELALRPIPVRQLERKRIVAPWLAAVGHVDLVGEPGGTVHLGRALDVARDEPSHRVRGDAGALHLEAVATVIDVAKVAPQPVVLCPAGDGEGRPSARRRPGDPATAGHEVADRRVAPGATDVG